jgi:hypothetical protein
MIHKFLYYVKNSARKDTSIVKSYITTKRGKAVATSILMPPRLADAWLAASALEGISRQEFLRRSLDERATRIFAAYLHPQTQVEEIESTPQTVTEISMLATHSETDSMTTAETREAMAQVENRFIKKLEQPSDNHLRGIQNERSL